MVEEPPAADLATKPARAIPNGVAVLLIVLLAICSILVSMHLRSVHKLERALQERHEAIQSLKVAVADREKALKQAHEAMQRLNEELRKTEPHQ